MSTPSNNSPPNIVPTITGNATIDTLLRNAIIAIAAAVAAASVTWLNAHGLNDPNLSLLISGAVASTLFALVGIAWGVWQSRRTQRAIVDNTIHAALTGEVSQAVAAKATTAQMTAVAQSPVASVAK